MVNKSSSYKVHTQENESAVREKDMTTITNANFSNNDMAEAEPLI